MTVSAIVSSPMPWSQLQAPPQGVVVQNAPDIQVASQTARPALPPTQSYPNSDALFARQREHEALTRANEDKEAQDARGQSRATNAAPSGASNAAQQRNGQLTPDQLIQINQLKARDTEVRQHEAAHQAAGGSYTGAASFSYQRGPDGRNYAIGGEVSVDASAIPGKPEETIAKMRVVQQAALAPADPSPQDRRVAANAARAILQAQSELMQQQEKARVQAKASHDSGYQAHLFRAATQYQTIFMADTAEEPHPGALFAIQA